MKIIQVRCLECENIYNKTISACPKCNSLVRDDVLINLPVLESRPILNFMPAMWRFPKVFGIQITSKN